jgi:hypothetical protein
MPSKRTPALSSGTKSALTYLRLALSALDATNETLSPAADAAIDAARMLVAAIDAAAPPPKTANDMTLDKDGLELTPKKPSNIEDTKM